MKVIPVHETHVVSHTGETIRAGIDAENLVQVLGVLTDLYSDPILAVVREYSTNALDAQVAAGYEGPIEVTLPDVEKDGPGSLVIRDHGVGLDIDELRKTYLSYGASTKRDSDDFNGTLGIGSKSGLTYAPNGFQVRTVKDGRLILAVVGKEADGVGAMSIMHEADTDEGNGVTITIPVEADDKWAFREAAEELFSYWAPGTVLVDGEQPASIRDDDALVWLDEDVAIGKHVDSKIVMGGVAYNLNKQSKWGYGIIAYVPMGAVHFTPSREELHYTDHTNETVEALVEFVDERAETEILRTVVEAETPFEALVAHRRVEEALGYHHEAKRRFSVMCRPWLPVRQVVLPTATVKHKVDGGYEYTPLSHPKHGYAWSSGGYGRGRNSAATFQTLQSAQVVNEYQNTIVILDFPSQARNLSAVHRERLDEFSHWLRNESGRDEVRYRSRYLLLPVNDFGDFRPDMLDGHPAVFTWDYVAEKTPRERAPRGSGARNKTVYHAMKGNDRIDDTGFDEADGPILMRHWGNRQYDSAFTGKFPEAQVVYLKDNQTERFLRNHPTAVASHTYAHAEMRKAEAALTDSDIMRWHAPAWKWLAGYVERIDDIELAEVLHTLTDRPTVRIERAKALGVNQPDEPEVFARLRDRYPLLHEISEWRRNRIIDDLLAYMNGKWAVVEQERQVVEAAEALVAGAEEGVEDDAAL